MRSPETVAALRAELAVVRRDLAAAQQAAAQATAEAAELRSLRQSLFNNMLDGYAHCRMKYVDGEPVDFLHLDVNPAFEAQTGLYGAVGRWVSEVIPGIRETNPELFEVYGRVALTGQPERLETCVEALGIWFDLAIYSPAPEHFVAVFDNVTERKRIEVELSQERTLLRTLIDAVPDVIHTKDRERRFALSNLAHLELCGATRESDLAGATVYDLHPPELAQAYDLDDQQVLHHGRPVMDREELVRIGDREYWYHTIKAPLRDPDGTVTGLVAISRNIQDRKEAEEAIRASEERFRRAVANIPDVVTLYGPDLRIRYINDATRPVTGVAPADFVGRTPAELLPPEVTAEFLPSVERAVATKETTQIEFDFALPGTAPRRLRSTYVPLLDDQGEVREVLGVTHDLTERRQHEQSLRASEDRYRRLVELAPDAIFVNRADRVDYVNAAALRLFGATQPEELLGRSVFELFEPASRPIVSERIKRLRTVREPVPPIDERIVRLDGTAVDVEVAAAPHVDDGQVVIQVMLRDVTESRRLLEQLRRSEALFRNIARHLPNGGVYVVGPDLRQIVAEGALTGSIGLGAAEMEGRTPTEVFGPEMGAYAEQRYTLTLSGQEQSDEVPFGDRTLWSQQLPLRDTDGQIFGALALSVDITHQKEIEEDIRLLNAQLEQRVEERTAELRAANDELESFAYAVSHDLRAPLRAMSGFSQALVEDYGGSFAPEAQVYLDQITAASGQMGELLDGLLVLSRSTRGELRRDLVDLSALARLVRHELQRTEPDRQVDWVIEPDLTCRGDARMLEVVVRNLLANAWKYTAQAPAPQIRFGLVRDAGRCWLTVEDNGAGFSMAHAGKLFQPFQRLHRQDEFPGLGIGLATVQRIVHRHGGELRALAAPGSGATFSLWLPELKQGMNHGG